MREQSNNTNSVVGGEDSSILESTRFTELVSTNDVKKKAHHETTSKTIDGADLVNLTRNLTFATATSKETNKSAVATRAKTTHHDDVGEMGPYKLGRQLLIPAEGDIESPPRPSREEILIDGFIDLALSHTPASDLDLDVSHEEDDEEEDEISQEDDQSDAVVGSDASLTARSEDDNANKAAFGRHFLTGIAAILLLGFGACIAFAFVFLLRN